MRLRSEVSGSRHRELDPGSRMRIESSNMKSGNQAEGEGMREMELFMYPNKTIDKK